MSLNKKNTSWYLVDPDKKGKFIYVTHRAQQNSRQRAEDAVTNILNYYLDMNETTKTQDLADSVKSAYQEEQVKIDNEAQVQIELSLKMMDLLDDYGYNLVPVLKGGLPDIELKPRL